MNSLYQLLSWISNPPTQSVQSMTRKKATDKWNGTITSRTAPQETMAIITKTSLTSPSRKLHERAIVTWAKLVAPNPAPTAPLAKPKQIGAA